MYICNQPFLPSYIGSGVGTCFLPNCNSQCLQKDNIISSNQIMQVKSLMQAQWAMHSCARMCVCVCACMRACVRACVCVCVCVCV